MGSLTIRRILVMRRQRGPAGGPPGASGANTDAPHGRPIGHAKDAATATGDRAGERQQAMDEVSAGLEALAKDFPEAKDLLTRFQRLSAKWVTGNATPGGAPDTEAGEPPDDEQAEGESAGPGQDPEMEAAMAGALGSLAGRHGAAPPA